MDRSLKRKACFINRLWYVVVGTVTLVWLGFRSLTIGMKPLRGILLRWKAGSIVTTHSHHGTKEEDCIDYICKVFPHEDWYVLYQLADNTDGIAFQNILEGLCERLCYKNGSHRRFSLPNVVIGNPKHELM